MRFKLVKKTKRHKVRVYEARITDYYRALARLEPELLLWFCIMDKPSFERAYR